MPLTAKVRSLLYAASGGHAFLVGYLLYNGNEKFYSDIVMPIAQTVIRDGETSHKIFQQACQYGLVPRSKFEHEILKSRVLGLEFPSPIGIAAGFDKNGDSVGGLFKMGFGFAEIGSVTPKPQSGNPKPRVFRLLEDSAIINRYGFPSVGQLETLDNLRKFPKETRKGPLGVNLGANKDSTDVVADFASGIETFKDAADFFVINVSSPNTPGLRAQQIEANLERVIKTVLSSRNEHAPGKPVLVKIAPDLTDLELQSIAKVSTKLGVDGLVITNTTVSRPESLRSSQKVETGGLSGRPLREMAQATCSRVYRLTQGKVPIIGVGGIESGKDAYDRIRAGASLVELYTALAYHGPPIVDKIKRELSEHLEKDGFKNVSEAVGVDSKI